MLGGSHNQDRAKALRSVHSSNPESLRTPPLSAGQCSWKGGPWPIAKFDVKLLLCHKVPNMILPGFDERNDQARIVEPIPIRLVQETLKD